jgi:hypothetical protein
MKKLLALAIVLGVAIVLILTKPTPQDIASAATGGMNYTVINKDKMPPDFFAAAAAAALLQGLEQAFSLGGGIGKNMPMKWHTSDLIFAMYSDLSVANVGSLKCLWLLRTGFCSYISR